MQNCNPQYKYKMFESFGTFWWIVSSIFFLIILSPHYSFSQDKIEYEEISVTLLVQGIGSTEIPALVHEKDLYLPINNLFDFIKIKNRVSPGIDSVSGFFINRNATFLIDKIAKCIIYENKVFNLNPEDFIRTETNLYLRIPYFGEVFGW